MFKPFFVDCSGKKHIFPDDRALKRSLALAWRRGEDVFCFKYRLKSSYTCGHSYQLNTIQQTCGGFVVCFGFESPLGKESYCF